MSGSGADDTYEMLWDCKYCSQKKNLGLTHRCCPSCGSPQDPAARYFPSDAEKVAVKDHPFYGADVHCPACKAANSRNAKCCGQCGSPLDKAAAVQLKIDQPPPAPPPPPKKGMSPLLIVVPIVVVLLIVGGLFMLFRKRDGAFVVKDKAWDRTTEVEKRVSITGRIGATRFPRARGRSGDIESNARRSKSPTGRPA